MPMRSVAPTVPLNWARLPPRRSERLTESLPSDGHLPLGRFQKCEQVCQFLAGQLLVKTSGHDRYRARTHLDHIRASDADFCFRSGRQDNFLRTVAPQDATMFLPRFGGDDHRLVTAHKTYVRIDDRLQQIALRANLANAREVGANLSSQVTNRVAGSAGGLLTVENHLAMPDVAVFQAADQIVEMRLLFPSIDVECGQEF